MRAIAVAATMAAFFLVATPAQALRGYMTNFGGSAMVTFDTSTNTQVGPSVPVLSNPQNLALTPDGSKGFIPRLATTMLTYETATSAQAGITTAAATSGIAVAPDGATAWTAVAPPANQLAAINTATNAVTPFTLAGAPGPQGLTMSPDGSRIYAGLNVPDALGIFDTSGQSLGSIPLGLSPLGVVGSPDGRHVFVNSGGISPKLAIVDVAAGAVQGSLIPVDGLAGDVASPDGKRLYVVDSGTNDVSVIDTTTNAISTLTHLSGSSLDGVTVSPDGSRLYVATAAPDIKVVDTTSGALAGQISIATPSPSIGGIVLAPAQAPIAKLSPVVASKGDSVKFDGSKSSDPDGTIARYDWDFGDGTTLSNGGATPSHKYTRQGSFTAKLTVTDSDGTSTEKLYNGNQMMRNGGPTAQATTTAAIVSLSAKNSQKVLKQKGVIVDEFCPAVCAGTATGSIKPSAAKKRKRGSGAKPRTIKLKNASAKIAAGKTAKLKLKLSKASLKKVRKALRGKRKATATVTASITDSATKASIKKVLKIKLKR